MYLYKWLTITDRFSRMYLDKELAPLQLNSGQHFYILKICDEPGITQDRLISLVHVNPSNVTRAITYLEKENFIEKKQNTKDRRTFHLYPTNKSFEVYDSILQIKKSWEEKFLNVLNEDEQMQLEALLKKVGSHAVMLMQEEKEITHESNNGS